MPRMPYELLALAARGEITLVLSPQVIGDVQTYVAQKKPEHLTKLEDFLATVKYELVPDPSPGEVAAHATLIRDASDIPIVLAAATANVNYLITTDPDLTNEETAKRVRERLGLRILRVGQFLDKVMGYSHDALAVISQRRWEDLGKTLVGEGRHIEEELDE